MLKRCRSALDMRTSMRMALQFRVDASCYTKEMRLSYLWWVNSHETRQCWKDDKLMTRKSRAEGRGRAQGVRRQVQRR